VSDADDGAAQRPLRPSPYPRSRGGGAASRAGRPTEESAESADNEPAEGTTPSSPPEGATDSEPSHSRHSRARRAWRGVARGVITVVSIIALLATGSAYLIVTDLRDSLHTTDPIGDLREQDDPAAPPEQDNATDILLVGTDARTDMQGNPLPARMLDLLNTERSSGINTDTLIVLRVPKNGDEPTAVSIPRDTWVTTPSGDKAKINSVFGKTKARTVEQLRAEGGVDAGDIARRSDQAGRTELVKTVQQFTGVRIDHYAEVNLLGFYLLTKALDGVTVCLKRPTRDTDSGANFPAGVQELNAAQALSFVRQRKNLPDGLGRIHRQQAFLASALHEILSTDTLSDSDRLDELVEAARRSMVLDPDLDLLRFAGRMRGIASDEVSFETIPVETISAHTSDGLSIVRTDADEVRDFMAGLVDGSGAGPSPSSVSGGGRASPASVSDYRFAAAEVPCVY